MDAPKRIYVTDASVIIKWLGYETDREIALALRQDFFAKKIHIIIPSFCFFEVCNIIALRWPKETEAFFSDLLNMHFSEYRLTLELASLANHLMQKYKGISFYDASYHALALQEGGTFVTADFNYFKKTKKEGRIMLLKDY